MELTASIILENYFDGTTKKTWKYYLQLVNLNTYYRNREIKERI